MRGLAPAKRLEGGDVGARQPAPGAPGGSAWRPKSRVDGSLGLSSASMFPSPGGAYPPPEELFAGRYAVDGTLPWGGVASYYRAHSEGTAVILCVLPIDLSRSKRAEAAFSELAHGLGSIRSSAVSRVLDAGIIDGVPYLAFQDMRGTLLGTLLRNRPLSSLNVLRLASEVLDALGAAHAQGLAHGDLTPQNIVVSRRRNGRLSAQLIGLGIVPLIRSFPEASPHATHTGSGKHAVAYMAPERFGGGIDHPLRGPVCRRCIAAPHGDRRTAGRLGSRRGV